MPTPFDDMRALLAACPDADEAARASVIKRQGTLAKPLGSLGRLEDVVAHLAAWQGKAQPVMMRPMICVFAANHGVVAQGVSAFPSDVTALMLKAYGAGGGTINQICAAYEFGFKAFELALEMPTADFTQGPALDEKACVATMAFGMEALAGGVDVLGLGEMGIGNTTSAAAIYATCAGGAGWLCGDGGSRCFTCHQARQYQPLHCRTLLRGRRASGSLGAARSGADAGSGHAAWRGHGGGLCHGAD